MEHGKGVKIAEQIGVHPSTVSRNKERIDIVHTSNVITQIEQVQANTNKLNKQ